MQHIVFEILIQQKITNYKITSWIRTNEMPWFSMTMSRWQRWICHFIYKHCALFILYKPRIWVICFHNRYICDCICAMRMCILIVRPNCYHHHSNSIIIMRIWNENKNVIQKSERKIWKGEEARDSLSYYISTVDYCYNVYFVFEILELSMEFAVC